MLIVKRELRGVTLVALVVTIIVILILAGVAANLAIGQNGIINIAAKTEKEVSNATTLENTALEAYENSIDKVTFNNNTETGISLIELLKFLAGLNENNEYERQIDEIVNSKETMDMICSNSDLFAVCINSKAIMSAMCESSVARNSMYDNAQTTEVLIAKSGKAIEIMMESSKYEVVKANMTTSFNTLYNGKAFVFGTSQEWHNGSIAVTMTHGNYIIGNQTYTYSGGGEGFGTTGLGIRINKFASTVQQKNSYGNTSNNYFYMAILKID